MDKIKELNKMKNDILSLELYVEQNSIYNLEEIAESIKNLMNAYEGVDYEVTYRYDEYNNEKCIITEKNRMNFSLMFIVPNTDKMRHKYLLRGNEENYCFFPPSEYSKNTINSDLSYIQSFIDYIFNYRTENKIENFNKQDLEICFINFINEKKYDQEIHKKNRKNHNHSRKNSELDNSFKKKCMLSRKTLFSNIISLVNNHEGFFTIAEHYKHTDWEDNISKHTKILNQYDTLSISHYNNLFDYSVLIDSCEVNEDELENAVVDDKADTLINFFELKNTIEELLKYNPILKKYMDNVEKNLLYKNYLSEDELNDIYLTIVNNEKNKIKRFE